MKILFLVRGVPGCGKTTLVKSLNASAVSADEYFIDKDGNYNWRPEKVKDAHEWCQNKVDNWMQQCDNVAVHNTFTREWEMEPYFKLAEKYGYQVTTIVVENRHGSKNVHNVPDDTIQAMKQRFEIVL